MKTIRPGAGFAVFLLFFGLALIEAIRNQKWLEGTFWIFVGILFFYADNMRSKHEKTDQ